MAAPRSTRQLLGELDALMDQMLSLPVDDSAPRTATMEPPPDPREDPAPAPHVPTRPSVHPLAVTMTLLEVPEETPAEESSVATDEIGERREPAGTSPAARQDIEPPPAPSMEFMEGPAPPIVKESFWVGEADLVPDPPARPLPNLGPRKPKPTSSRPLDVTAPPIVPLPSRPISRLYGFALRTHRMIARRTYGFGVVGRAIRSDLFVTILGVLGILMLIVAAGWLLKDLVRWT